MDFTFSAEQEHLREVARGFLADRAMATRDGQPSYVRRMLDDPAGVTDDMWAALVDLGWTSLLVPEAHGGAGLGLLEVVVLAEETGRLPLPGPWLSSAVLGTRTAVALGDDEALPGLAEGRRRATLALEETGTRDPLDPAGIGTRATPDGDGWRVTGTKPIVLDGHTADLLYVVAAEPGGGVATFAVEAGARGCTADLVPNLDVTRTVARVVLDDAPARRVGPPGDQRGALGRVVDDVAVALCAESVGACERALELATDHAKARVQFGRPIATFQVIRHKLVDMLHQLELARVATHYAAWATAVCPLDTAPAPGAAAAGVATADATRVTAVAMAKGFVAEAATMITGQCIQVHGGVGFTWDVDCHLLFRRVKANDVLFGRQAWQRQRLSDLVLGAAG
jgi:alkylation response protein AidB-like acyl-CoA dehydrogenase